MVTLEPQSALEAWLSNITSLSIGSNKNIFVAEGFFGRVRVIDPSGQISLLAGASPRTGLDGPAAFARVDVLRGDLATDNAGNTFIASFGIIHKIDPAGRISAFVDYRTRPILGVGIFSIAIDPSGQMFALDWDGRVLRIGSDGEVSVIAGANGTGFSGDGGPAALARFTSPVDVAIDTEGVIYIADEGANRIRRIALDGTIDTIAGTGVDVSAGDNGPASLASLKPIAIAFDRKGDLLVVEGRHRVRRIAKADGRITSVIGDGTCHSE